MLLCAPASSGRSLKPMQMEATPQTTFLNTCNLAHQISKREIESSNIINTQSLPKTILFRKFLNPKLVLEPLRKGFQQKACKMMTLLYIEKIRKRAPEGPRMEPKMVPKSGQNQFLFRSGASELQLLVPRVPGGGYRTQMDRRIHSKWMPTS